MEENKNTFWWKLVNLEPVTVRAMVMATGAMLGSFGLIIDNQQLGAIVGFIAVLMLIGQALWTRSSVTPNAKVAVSVPDPVNEPHIVEAGEAKTTASSAEILDAAKN